jgi:hypothetical protein
MCGCVQGHLVALNLTESSPLLPALVHPGLRPLRTTYEGDFGVPLGDVYYLQADAHGSCYRGSEIARCQGDEAVHETAALRATERNHSSRVHAIRESNPVARHDRHQTLAFDADDSAKMSLLCFPRHL